MTEPDSNPVRNVHIRLAPGPLCLIGDTWVGGLEAPMTIGRTAMAMFDEQIARATSHIPMRPPIRR